MTHIVLELLGDDTAPVSPIWGVLNAALNGATLVVVALVYTRK